MTLTMISGWDQQAKFAAEQYGWKPSPKDHNTCPRVLVGKRHQELGCWCRSFLNDHGREWVDEDGVRFVLWEPYHATGEEFIGLVRIADQDGLAVTMTRSAWASGKTLGIRFDPATSSVGGDRK